MNGHTPSSTARPQRQCNGKPLPIYIPATSYLHPHHSHAQQYTGNRSHAAPDTQAATQRNSHACMVSGRASGVNIYLPLLLAVALATATAGPPLDTELAALLAAVGPLPTAAACDCDSAGPAPAFTALAWELAWEGPQPLAAPALSVATAMPLGPVWMALEADCADAGPAPVCAAAEPWAMDAWLLMAAAWLVAAAGPNAVAALALLWADAGPLMACATAWLLATAAPPNRASHTALARPNASPFQLWALARAWE